MGQKLRKLQMADFEQIWDFSVFLIFDRFIHSFFKFDAQITRTKLLNLRILLDFKNNQPFSKHHTRKVKFCRVKIGNECFATRNCGYFFIYNVFEAKIYH